MAKVLLVEDDNNLREIYEARLTAEGYEIITAQNGEEALSAAKQNKPDLVISDVMMPRISGFEMLDILRNTDELKNTKVIMLTALGQAEDRNRADNLGADKYLVKSQVTLEDIVNAAKELLSDEPTQVAMPSIPQPSVPVPEPVVAVQTAVPVAAAPDQPTPTVVDQPIATPAVPTASPATTPAPVVPEAVASTPIVPDPIVEPVAQTDSAVPAEPSAVANPTPGAPTTTVTVTDPDPITQRISPPAELLVPEEPPVVNPQTTTPAPVVPEAVASTPIVPDPIVEPVAQTDSAVPAEPSAEPQSIAAEEAAIEAQIASFAASEQLSAPAPTANDAILDDAINKLTAVPGEAIPPVEQPEVSAPVDEPAAEPVEQPTEIATPEEPVDTTSQIAGRKVIQPLSDAEAGTANLDVLLAKEAAKEAANNVANPQPVVSSDTPGNSPRSGFDPNSIAL